MKLSERGQHLVNAPMPTYLSEHFERGQQQFDATERPDGYIGLCVAENSLMWDLWRTRIQSARAVPASALRYDTMCGSERFRRQLAGFLSKHLAHRPIAPEHVIALAGAGSVVESLFYALADAGDGVLVPTPSYAGFWMDLELRNGLRIVPVHRTEHEAFQLNVDTLEHALRSSPRRIRALLLTRPDNPLGTAESLADFDACVAWAKSRGLHVVVDEIYALSTFGGTNFESALKHSPDPNVHVVWGFSKDFAASGLRCGILVSSNEELVQAVSSLAYWSCCSGDTQFLLGEMLSDEVWLETYLKTMRERLADSYERASRGFVELGFRIHPAEAGFFFFAHAGAHGDFTTFSDERRFWQTLVDDANISLTPGEACHSEQPGWFRVCHASASSQAIDEAVLRLRRTLA